MSDSQNKGGNSAVTVAIIGGLFTLLAAVIGLAPTLLEKYGGQPDKKNRQERQERREAARPAKPPVTLSYRKSAVPGQGLVMGITNTSDKPLVGVSVSVRSPKEPAERTHRLKKDLAPNDSAAVGFLQLDGWKLREGDTVTVRADGYAEAVENVVPPG